MEKNVGSIDRIIRIVVGIVLLLWGVGNGGLLGWIAVILGLIVLLTGILGWCWLYKLLKINTNKK